MSYPDLVKVFCAEPGVEESTMMFERESALIVKLPAERVNELVGQGAGREFNFTGKKFKEWVLIPEQEEALFEGYVREALEFARAKKG